MEHAVSDRPGRTRHRVVEGLAPRHPERIAAIISQNGNAYEEGLSEGSNLIQR